MKAFRRSNAASLLLLVPLYFIDFATVALCSSEPVQLLQTVNPEYQRLARKYNKIVGTHQIDPRYQFEPNEHYLYEGAQRMLAAGFTTITLKFQPQYANQSTSQDPMTILEIAKNPDFSIEAVLDLPFSTFFMWMSFPQPIDEGKAQMSQFTEYLMKRYQGTGKTFMLGTWKADSLLRYWVPWPGMPNASTPLDPRKVKTYPSVLQAQVAAIGETQKRLAGIYSGVQVYSYIEVNLMKNATINFTVIDDIVPKLDPAPDYISVSVSTLMEYVTDLNPARKLYPMLDHVHGKLPLKEGVPEPRVFVGEFEFPRLTMKGDPDPHTPTQENQAQYALAVAAASLSWGAPYAAWWTFYDNTRTLKDKDTGIYEDRGFALVTHENKTTVLYDALLEYMTDAKQWLYQKIQDGNGTVPCFNDYRQWAAFKLIDLARGIGGSAASKITLPPFISRECSA